jgi:hypothetical protein
VIEGFCALDINPFGPVQLYVAPPDEVRFKVAPLHTGLLLPAVALGDAFTVTTVVAVAVQPPASVTVTVYVPEAAVVTVAIEGFC